jgi:inorganic pyrophosphatase
MAFPLDFGFVPGTHAEDGDPLDVLILADEGCAIGSLVTVRLLGVIEAEQTEDGKTARNDRLIAKIAQSHAYRDVETLAQLGEGFVEDLRRFFVTYNDLKGKRFRVLATSDAARAAEIVLANSLG